MSDALYTSGGIVGGNKRWGKDNLALLICWLCTEGTCDYVKYACEGNSSKSASSIEVKS